LVVNRNNLNPICYYYSVVYDEQLNVKGLWAVEPKRADRGASVIFGKWCFGESI